MTAKATQTLAYKRDVTVPEASGLYYSTATKYQGKPAEGPDSGNNETMPAWQLEDDSSN